MFCNYCGATNPGDASFCRDCGKRVVPPGHQEAERGSPSAIQAAPQTAAASPVAVYVPPESASGGKGLWIASVLAGASAVAIVAFVVLQFRVSQPQDDPSLFVPSGTVSSNGPPAQERPAPPPPAPEAPPPAAASPPPAPLAPAPVAPAPAPSPQAQIVGEWKTKLLIGEGTLTLTRDGHYRVKNVFVNETGIYTYASDGALRLQVEGVFDHTVTVWQAQLSPDGDSLSVIEPEGAAHVYTRVGD